MKHKKLIKAAFGFAAAITAVCTGALFAACGEKNEGDGHVHKSEKYAVSETEHWKVCGDCGETFDKGFHVLKDGVCEVCGYYENYSEGLEFEEITDESGKVISYAISGVGLADDENLRLPYYYEGLPVTYIGEAAFKDCEFIKSVIIPDTYTDAGFYAFQNCTNLESVKIGDGLWQVTFCVFDGCESLTDVEFGNGVKVMGEWAFRNCTSLTKLYLPDSLTDLNGGAFDGCSNLEYTEYDNAYYFGSRTNPYMVLKQVINKSVAEMQIHEGTKFIIGDFKSCTNLTEIVLPEGLLSFARSAFENCSSLTEIYLPDSLTSIGGSAFLNCKKLATVRIGANVVSIGMYAFSGCSVLTSVTFANPEGWYYKTMLNVEETTDIEDDLSDTAVAAECVKTKYTNYFMLHD